MRLWDAQFIKENLRHVGVVVLTGMEYLLFDTVAVQVGHSTAHGCGFDNLGTCPYDGEYLHGVYLITASIKRCAKVLYSRFCRA